MLWKFFVYDHMMNQIVLDRGRQKASQHEIYTLTKKNEMKKLGIVTRYY